MRIKKISANKILASLGDYTLEATIEFEGGEVSVASVPAGISAGKYEVKKVTADAGLDQIDQINQIVSGKDWAQETLDEVLDKLIHEQKFGGNATLAVSAAFFKASNSYKLQAPASPGRGRATSFPKIMLLLFEGAEHGNKNITMQEFMLVCNNVNDASEAYARMTHYLKTNQVETTVGAEGGFSPLSFDNNKCLETIRTVFPNGQICIDMADCFNESPIPDGVFSVEDPYDDESWDKWVALDKSKFLVIGDDLTTTNPERIKKAIELKAVTGVVIKPNQIGTITKAIEATKLAQSAGLKIIVSHRGQETNDSWIVDFGVFVGADYFKIGGMDRGERIAKYNRLIELSNLL